MAESALSACYRAIRSRLTESSVESWGARVFLEQAQASSDKRNADPFVVYGYSSGGQEHELRTGNGYELLIDVLCIADSFSLSQAGAARISELLADSGTQDAHPAPMLLNEWEIISVAEEGVISMQQVDQTRPIWLNGAMYRFYLYPKG